LVFILGSPVVVRPGLVVIFRALALLGLAFLLREAFDLRSHLVQLSEPARAGEVRVGERFHRVFSCGRIVELLDVVGVDVFQKPKWK
jgi:hypothetical protein